MNLLKETLEVLNETGKTVEDVRWVGSRCGCFALSWAKAKGVLDVDYDEGFGAQEIADDLVVVGDDWWLERCEYDGKEWWQYKSRPQRTPSPLTFSKVKVAPKRVGWQSLKQIEGEK